MARFCVLAAALAIVAGGVRATAGSFPCRWTWDLHTGLKVGYVNAGENANCTGRTGSLTLSVQLHRLDLRTKRWRLARKQTRSWTNLRGNRYVEVYDRCRYGKVRAVFNWVLRDTAGKIVATNVVRTPAIGDPGPGCHLVLR